MAHPAHPGTTGLTVAWPHGHQNVKNLSGNKPLWWTWSPDAYLVLRYLIATVHLNVSSMKPWISFMLLYSLLLLLPGAGASSEIHLYQTQYYYSLTCHMPLTTPVGCSAFFVLHDNTFFAPRQGLSLGGRSKTTSIGFWPIFDLFWPATTVACTPSLLLAILDEFK